MTVQISNLIGFETGGLEEACGTAGSPSIATDRVRSGTYALKMAANAWYKFLGVDDGGAIELDDTKGMYVEFYINFDTLGISADTYFFTAINNWPSETSWPFYFRLNTDDTISVFDVATERIVDADCGLQPDTWHRFQFYWTFGDSGQSMYLYVDGGLKGSATNCDTRTGTSVLNEDVLVYRFRHDGTNLPTYWVDDVVSKVNCDGISDRFANNWKVSKGYQNTAEDATDQGDTLDDGTWADASEIPFADDSSPNLATYTGNGDAGHMRTDEGTRSGPGSDIDGTPVAAKFIHRVEFDNTNTPAYQRIGKYTSGGSDSYSDISISPAVDPVNHKYITENTSYVPQTTNDYFVLGMKLSASNEMYLHEAVAFLLQETLTQRGAQISWAELEVPDGGRGAQISWAEIETPNGGRGAQVSWAELEAPDGGRGTQISWAELETPDGGRGSQISWAEMEVPSTDRQVQVSWAEMETPDAPRGTQISWAEMETPDSGRGTQISWAELELPEGGRGTQISWAEFEVKIAMLDYIVLDGKKYRTLHSNWRPIYDKPGRVRLVISGDIDATFGSAIITGWEGTIVGPITSGGSGWGTISDLRTSTRKKTAVEMTDHYGDSKYVLVMGSLNEKSRKSRWDSPSNKFSVAVKIYIVGDAT